MGIPLTSSATSTTDPTSTGTLVCVAASAADVDASLEPVWRDARRVVLLLLSGPAAAPGVRATEVRSLALPTGTVAATPELVARLRTAFDEIGAAVVLAPHPAGAGLETRATTRAVAAAITNGTPRTLVLYTRGTSAVSSPIEGRVALAELRRFDAPRDPALLATAVVSTWNKCADVRANLEALRAQTLP